MPSVASRNESEDLAKNNLENEVWVKTTLNDMMANFGTGTPQLENAWEDISSMAREEPI